MGTQVATILMLYAGRCDCPISEAVNFHTALVIASSVLGREEEARAEAAEVLRVSPDFSLEKV
jgi:hypothetical protein